MKLKTILVAVEIHFLIPNDHGELRRLWNFKLDFNDFTFNILKSNRTEFNNSIQQFGSRDGNNIK